MIRIKLKVGVILASVLVVTACGETFIDHSAVRNEVPNTTFVPIDANAPISDLLAQIRYLMSDLDERIIDHDDDVVTMARIDELWSAAEPAIRAVNPDDVSNFAQAIDLARSGVERLRPADASKGYKVLVAVIAAYDSR